MQTTPKVKMTTGMGTVYYANCPNCGKFHMLTREQEGDKVICKKCGSWFQLGAEVDHEDDLNSGD